MRLVLLTQYYPPETGAPQNRLSDLARRLVARGHRVEVLTGMPNYPAGRIHAAWRGRAFARDVVDGVPVTRTWLYATPRKSVPLQLACYGTFAASAAVAGLVALRRADVLMWESPPLFLAPTAAAVAARLGARLVMNVSDLWPRSAVDLGVLKDRRLTAFFEAWERWAYRSAALVTCQTDGIAAGVRERWPDAATRAFPNGVDTAMFRRGPRDPELLRALGVPADATVVGYAGNFGRAQAMEQVVDAAARLRERPGVWFLLAGAGPCRGDVGKRALQAGLDRVRFVDPMPRDRMPALQSCFDVSIVPLADLPLFQGARPSKMFELLAMEVPFVYCGERGEGADIAVASGAGTLARAQDPDDLARALAAWIDAGPDARRKAGRAGRKHVVRHFDRDAIAADLERALTGL